MLCVLGDERTNGAARFAAACCEGTQSWTQLDDCTIHDLRAAGEVYVFSLDNVSDHPALLAAKARTVTDSRRTVVYYSPDGIAKAIEPKSIA